MRAARRRVNKVGAISSTKTMASQRLLAVHDDSDSDQTRARLQSTMKKWMKAKSLTRQ